MRPLAGYNPAVTAAYFAAVVGVAMCCMDPILLGIALFGGVLCTCVCGGGWRIHAGAAVLFAALVLVNPLLSANGETVLFVLNHNPVTLQAVIYGLTAAAMIVGALYWLRLFSKMMNSEKWLYLFGALSPQSALVLSMALRFLPYFRRQTQRIRDAQRVFGMYKEENVIDTLRGETRVFSIMVTRALENGIVTADSMAARGYGTGRRSHFSVWRFSRADAVLLLLIVALAALAIFGEVGRGTVFYPRFVLPPVTAAALVGYVAFTALVLLPTVLQLWEGLRWHFWM